LDGAQKHVHLFLHDQLFGHAQGHIHLALVVALEDLHRPPEDAPGRVELVHVHGERVVHVDRVGAGRARVGVDETELEGLFLRGRKPGHHRGGEQAEAREQPE
jgi:hypothetical protein